MADTKVVKKPKVKQCKTMTELMLTKMPMSDCALQVARLTGVRLRRM